MRSSDVCVPGFVSVRVISIWFGALFERMLPCFVKHDASRYERRNRTFVSVSAQTSVVRQCTRRTSRVRAMVVAVLYGVFEALSLILAGGAGDAVVLALLALALATRYWRWYTIAILLYTIIVHPFPTVHAVVRGICIVSGMLCGHGRLSWPAQCVRAAVASMLLIAYAGGACVSKYNSVSPVAVLSIAFGIFRANPVIVLTLAILVR